MPTRQCPCCNQVPTSAPALPPSQRLNLLTLRGRIPVGCRCPPRPPGPPFPPALGPSLLPMPPFPHPVSAPLSPTPWGESQLAASPDPSSISCQWPSLLPPPPLCPLCCSSNHCLLCCCPRCPNGSGPPCLRLSCQPLSPGTGPQGQRLGCRLLLHSRGFLVSCRAP